MVSYLEDLLEGVDQLGTHTVAGNQCAGGSVGAVVILQDQLVSGYNWCHLISAFNTHRSP